MDYSGAAIVWVCFVLFFAIISIVGFIVDVRRIRKGGE